MKIQKNIIEDLATKKFIDFFGAISMLLINFPATRAIGLIGTLLAKIVPQGFEIFQKIVGNEKLNTIKVPQPTKAQVITFFERYKALREAFGDYISQSGEVNSADYRFLKSVYLDMVYSISFETLKEDYPYVDVSFLRAQIKRNEKFISEAVDDLASQIRGEADIFGSDMFMDMTIDDIRRSVRDLTSIDFSSKAFREKLVGTLKKHWPPIEIGESKRSEL